MIKTIPLTLLIFFLACSSASATSYLIETTDGREIETSTYWTEGGEIKIEVGEGTILGIPTGEVKRIKKVAGQRKSHVDEKIPQEAVSGATPLKQEQTLPDGSNHTTTNELPVLKKYGKELTAFVKKLDHLDGLSKAELKALVAEGETLKRKMLADPEAPHLHPLLFMLYKEFDKIEEAIRQKK